MTITTITNGDLFESGADLLVNPTNCQGIPGALAGVFAQKFPKDTLIYQQRCAKGIKPGEIYITCQTLEVCIAHFATVLVPGGTSQLAWIETGLSQLHDLAQRCRYQSIAIPALGCGVGGLDFDRVKALVEAEFKDSPIQVLLHEPKRQRGYPRLQRSKAGRDSATVSGFDARESLN
jgi:O-acetyl-ADP-ribose deacetylase (regulator of RNase III)